MSTLVIVTAAGSGTRLGRPEPKALAPLAGEPLVVHAVLGCTAVADAVVVTVPTGLEGRIRGLLDGRVGVPVRVVAGGATRQASVAAGLAAANDDVETVLVHDAARALAPPELFRQVADAVRAGHGAVVPALPVADTVKRVCGPGPDGAEPVVETLDRATLRAVQTPQGFAREVLERAHRAARHRAGSETTAASDDAGLVEALGEPVVLVPGDPRAAKITTAHDLRVAELTYREER